MAWTRVTTTLERRFHLRLGWAGLGCKRGKIDVEIYVCLSVSKEMNWQCKKRAVCVMNSIQFIHPTYLHPLSPALG